MVSTLIVEYTFERFLSVSISTTKCICLVKLLLSGDHNSTQKKKVVDWGMAIKILQEDQVVDGNVRRTAGLGR